MPLDTQYLRQLANTRHDDVDLRLALIEGANYIDLLRKQLNEAHSCNEDSERLNWLSQQAHEERCEPAHRTYFKLPMVLKSKYGATAHNLREAIDMVRKPRRHE